MSSSNLVKITYVEETTYGEKPSPLSGVTMKTFRRISDSLSGTPITTESQEQRIDRNPTGQVVTGLEVNGGIDFELAPDTCFDDFFRYAMMSAWVAAETVNTSVTLTPDGGDDQLAVLTITDEFANLVVGTLVKIEAAAGDIYVQVISVDTPSTVFSVATARGQVALSETANVILPQYLDIGTTKPSAVISKAYEDVLHGGGSDEHSQTYLGELVSGFSVNSQYGEIVTGEFSMLGNGYEQEAPSLPQQVIAAGGSVSAAGTELGLNASIDIPLVTQDGFVASDYCIENFSLQLDNSLAAQNCIGKQAPTDYTLGTARVSASIDVYLSETSYDAFMAAKLSAAAISMTFVCARSDGGYAFQLPAMQMNFPDPASESGDNAQTMINASGVAKVGTGAIASALRVYKL